MGKRSTLKVSSLFGPPPVIEAGEAAAYDELYGRVCAAVRPVDVIYEMLIVDTVYLQLEIFRLRRWKSTWIQERGLEALHHFLSGLDYQHYRPRYAGYLEKALQGSLPNQQAPSLADLLCLECAACCRQG